MLGVSLVSPGFSLVSAMRGVAAMMGPPLAGVVVDMYQDTQLSMDLSAGVIGLALIFSIITFIGDKRYSRRTSEYINI